MRRWTGTSALAALQVTNGCQKSPLGELEMKFSFFIFKPQVALDIFDPQLDTILSVGISLTYFRRKLFKFE